MFRLPWTWRRPSTLLASVAKCIEGLLGKPVGSDVENRKATYPSLYGIEKSKQMALQAVGDAVNALRVFGSEADPLRALARFVIDREA